jgi:hypothetical protein
MGGAEIQAVTDAFEMELPSIQARAIEDARFIIDIGADGWPPRRLDKWVKAAPALARIEIVAVYADVRGTDSEPGWIVDLREVLATAREAVR